MKLSIRNMFMIICSIIFISAISIGVVYAIDSYSGNSEILITDAIKAGDVCEAHLVQNCTECDGYELYSSYRTVCPYCNKNMSLCCSGQIAEDDHHASCLVYDHPSGCETIQDLYWNAYYCSDCGYFQRGSRDDDYHVEAYWHTKTSCYDHTYCSLPRLSDLISSNDEECSIEKINTDDAPDASNKYADEYEAALAAGDICEICGKLACKTLHEDK